MFIFPTKRAWHVGRGCIARKMKGMKVTRVNDDRRIRTFIFTVKCASSVGWADIPRKLNQYKFILVKRSQMFRTNISPVERVRIAPAARKLVQMKFNWVKEAIRMKTSIFTVKFAVLVGRACIAKKVNKMKFILVQQYRKIRTTICDSPGKSRRQTDPCVFIVESTITSPCFAAGSDID